MTDGCPEPSSSTRGDDSQEPSSSSSDDFASFLDDVLDSESSDSDLEPDQDLKHSDCSQSSQVADDVHYDFWQSSGKRTRVDMLEEIQDSGFKKPRAVSMLEEIQDSSSTSVSFQQGLEASCTHSSGSFGDMCILCGERVAKDSGVTFAYIHKGLRLYEDEIVRLRTIDMQSLMRQRKLCLVLDLDHTLLNSTLLVHLTDEENYLKEKASSCKDVSQGSLFMLEFMHMMTKLRPSVRTFLKEASEMFEMYIYTMGDRAYAFEMAKLLDPKREYFDGRVISREDGTEKHQKGLDVVLGQESAVLILDDTESAWKKHKDNLIVMERYHFFASSCRQFGFKNCKSLSELKSDENESSGALSSVLKVLRQTHKLFFDEEVLDNVDARELLKKQRREILRDCNILFGHEFPAGKHPLWQLAERMGAACFAKFDSSITHVASTDAATEKSCWAIKEKKFLVHPKWIETANYFWQKQPEEDFSINQKNHH